MVPLLDRVPVDRALTLLATLRDGKTLMPLALAPLPFQSSVSASSLPPHVTAVESLPIDRSLMPFKSIRSEKLQEMPSRITRPCNGNDLYNDDSTSLSQASACLVTATDATERLGTSPTCVSAMPLCEATDVRTLLKDACGTYSDLSTHLLEVPVWCGRISIGATIKDESSLRPRRETIDARVVITASSNVAFYPEYVLQGRFSCERFDAAAALPPSSRGMPESETTNLCWGKILPATEADVPTLLKLGRCLSEFDHVAVPPAYRQHHTYYLMQQQLDIRIVTKHQALRMRCPLPDWVLASANGSTENDLLCYWSPVARGEKATAATHRKDALLPSLVPIMRPQQPLIASS
jgi:hypothetical protein